jgi:RNA 2',3'-cyclic 3'-phosphodiesterase
MRLFFAIPLPNQIKQILQNKCLLMKNKFPPGVWVQANNYHITLSFLGDTETQMLPQLSDLANLIGSSFTQGSLELTDMNAFPSRRNVRTLFCSISNEGWLEDLGLELRRNLFALGFKIDTPFHSHITLARFRDPVKQHFSFPWNQFIVNEKMNFTCFELLDSHLKPTGPLYTTVATFNVSKEDKTDGRKG